MDCPIEVSYSGALARYRIYPDLLKFPQRIVPICFEYFNYVTTSCLITPDFFVASFGFEDWIENNFLLTDFLYKEVMP